MGTLAVLLLLLLEGLEGRALQLACISSSSLRQWMLCKLGSWAAMTLPRHRPCWAAGWQACWEGWAPSSWLGRMDLLQAPARPLAPYLLLPMALLGQGLTRQSGSSSSSWKTVPLLLSVLLLLHPWQLLDSPALLVSLVGVSIQQQQQQMAPTQLSAWLWALMTL